MSIKMTLPGKMYPLMTKKQRFLVFLGGRGAAKSMSIIDVLIYRVATEGIKVLCLRMHMNSIADSVHSLISDEITRMNVPGFTVNNHTITHENGGTFRFRGLATNIEGLKSYSGFNVFFVEEASTILKKALSIMTPTLRTENSQIIFALNPDSKTDAMSVRFINPFIKELRKNKLYEDKQHYISWINYYDNPFFPDVLNEERKLDKTRLSSIEYNHIWLGEFYDTVENSIIKQEWAEACIDAHIKLGFEGTNYKIVGHDPADSGKDAIALVMRNGSIIEEAILSDLKDVNEGLDWALDYSINNQADLFVWDSDGMGVSLKRQVKNGLEGENIDYVPFHGGGKVENPNYPYEDSGTFITNKDKQRSNKQVFRNLRAQKYWDLRTRVYNTYLAITKPEYKNQDSNNLISFSSKITNLDQLIIEICKIPRIYNSNGMIQIMDKKRMFQLYQIESPNLADSLMMSLVIPEIKEVDEEELIFSNPWG